MAVSSTDILDVSFAGAKVQIAGIVIDDFMDDSNPIEIQPIEVSNVGVNCNGRMIRYAKPSVVMVSVTVIPRSQSDKALRNLVKQYHIEDGKPHFDVWRANRTCTIALASGQSYTLEGGTLVSGPVGPTATGDGKMQGRTYTFAFAAIR